MTLLKTAKSPGPSPRNGEPRGGTRPTGGRAGREQKQPSQVVCHYEVQGIPAPDSGIDERNGWHDRGNPLDAFDPEARISLVSDELGRLFQWILFGGSVRDRSRNGPVNQKAKAVCQGREFQKALDRPEIIAFRVMAMMLRLRPDLLEGMTAVKIAKRVGLHPRMLAHYTISFGENFPSASKVIRRRSRLVNDEVLRQRHAGAHHD